MRVFFYSLFLSLLFLPAYSATPLERFINKLLSGSSKNPYMELMADQNEAKQKILSKLESGDVKEATKLFFRYEKDYERFLKKSPTHNHFYYYGESPLSEDALLGKILLALGEEPHAVQGVYFIEELLSTPRFADSADFNSRTLYGLSRCVIAYKKAFTSEKLKGVSMDIKKMLALTKHINAKTALYQSVHAGGTIEQYQNNRPALAMRETYPEFSAWEEMASNSPMSQASLIIFNYAATAPTEEHRRKRLLPHLLRFADNEEIHLAFRIRAILIRLGKDEGLLEERELMDLLVSLHKEYLNGHRSPQSHIQAELAEACAKVKDKKVAQALLDTWKASFKSFPRTGVLSPNIAKSYLSIALVAEDTAMIQELIEETGEKAEGDMGMILSLLRGGQIDKAEKLLSPSGQHYQWGGSDILYDSELEKGINALREQAADTLAVWKLETELLAHHSGAQDGIPTEGYSERLNRLSLGYAEAQKELSGVHLGRALNLLNISAEGRRIHRENVKEFIAGESYVNFIRPASLNDTIPPLSLYNIYAANEMLAGNIIPLKEIFGEMSEERVAIQVRYSLPQALFLPLLQLIEEGKDENYEELFSLFKEIAENEIIAADPLDIADYQVSYYLYFCKLLASEINTWKELGEVSDLTSGKDRATYIRLNNAAGPTTVAPWLLRNDPSWLVPSNKEFRLKTVHWLLAHPYSLSQAHNVIDISRMSSKEFLEPLDNTFLLREEIYALEHDERTHQKIQNTVKILKALRARQANQYEEAVRLYDEIIPYAEKEGWAQCHDRSTLNKVDSLIALGRKEEAGKVLDQFYWRNSKKGRKPNTWVKSLFKKAGRDALARDLNKPPKK